jgi:threonyl-tRNA synthetase
MFPPMELRLEGAAGAMLTDLDGKIEQDDRKVKEMFGEFLPQTEGLVDLVKQYTEPDNIGFAKVPKEVREKIIPKALDRLWIEMMRASMPEPDRYYLKAMNCPHHHRIFAAEPHSYRDLPLRLAEYGTCYRYEQSGELFGLMRVRSLNMNDAHIYCTEEQFADEFRAVNDMYLKYLRPRKISDALQHARGGRAGQEIRQRTRVVEEDRGHGAPGVDRIRHQLRGGRQRGGVLRAED